MFRPSHARIFSAGVLLAGILGFSAASSSAETLRVVTYNINADTSDFETYPQSTNLQTVLQGIGDVHLNDNGKSNAQPIDILAVQELQNGAGGPSAPTLATIVANLNTKYGAGTYAYDPTPDPTDGALDGNGPSGLVYNTKTVKVVSATALGSASGSGAPRAPMQYRLQPIGFPSAADFYLDVSHMKSDSDSTSVNRRQIEANTIVNNAVSLGSNAHIISLGDFNFTNGSAEGAYQTLAGQFTDVGNPAENWSDTSSTSAKQYSYLLSEKATQVRYRDDMQFTSSAAYSGSSSPGLQYDQGSYTVFGNGGSSSLEGNEVQNLSANSGVFPDLSAAERSSILAAEEDTTDHLPVVADYDIVGFPSVPEPATLGLIALGGALFFHRPARR